MKVMLKKILFVGSSDILIYSLWLLHNILRFTAYKVESEGRLFRCGTLRMLCKS